MRPLWEDTENPRTTGRRYDPAELTTALAREAARSGLQQSFPPAEQLVLATGGFPVRVARERGLLVRSNRWSEGDGLDHARGLGAATSGDLDELYARAMPAPPARIEESDYVRLSQLYGGRARVTNERGEEFFPQPPAWHENDLAQAIARQPGGTAWFELDDPSTRRCRLPARREARSSRSDGRVRVHVAAGVTHTLGGLRVDEHARVLREDGTPIDGLFAAGVDVGGVASGGYASGLAQALVLGLVAARVALTLSERADAVVAGKRRDAELDDLEVFLVVLDAVAGLRRLAILLAQQIPGRRPDEEQVGHGAESYWAT